MFVLIKPFRIQNTWMGEPSKLILLKCIIDEIRRENLLQLVQKAGDAFVSGLEELQV